MKKTVTKMLQFDFSQLPIMRGEREVKGMISWKSISSSTSDIAIVEPVGGGLDDEAARAVETWKFRAGMFSGRSVPVRITVEVSFNMW